ncbi:MAG: TrkH family potassium uptake protein [Verrucomicrobia bacterium]|jgi:trk system potassium uptake protein|nr:TrkH family potassium uptake protein [Verrucomicrobiota bacterium]
MNYRNILKVIGSLLIVLCILELICLAYSAIQEPQGFQGTAKSFAISAAVSGIAGMICLFFRDKNNKELLRKEAIAVVGLGWIICAVFGAIPYMLCTPVMSPVDSIFESMSGFTTTGASVIRDLTQYPKGILLWRSLTQWLGGMGILVLFVALLSSLRIGSRAIFLHESSANEIGGVANRTGKIALKLWTLYLAITFICLGGFKLFGMSWFDAVCHTFATVSTGGFSTHNESIAFFQSPGIELWTIFIMVVCSINFILYAWILKRRWDRWRDDEESKVFLIILLLGTLVIGIDLTVFDLEGSALHSFRVAAFQVVSIMTTTGFITADFSTWPPLSDVLLLLLMIIGGCAGSTSGGVKLSRWILFIKSIKAQINTEFRPSLITHLRLNGRPVSDALRIGTLFFVGLSSVTIMLATLVVSLLEPRMDIDSSVSAVLATLFNIGPGLGSVGPTHNFADLASYTKLLLCFLMAVGRLEFYAIFVLFFPSLWKRY